MIILLSAKINHNTKNKKTAWELLKEIPETVEQRRIDREIAVIERKYEEAKAKISKSSKINENETCKIKEFDDLDIKNYYGWSAGKIWNALNKYGPLNQSSIIQYTKLSLNEFFIGVGWLARENKISKDMKCYKLGNTNLTCEIGENAGKIWQLLDFQGKADISTITKLTDMEIEEVYSVIGWLSRENKIKLFHKDRKLIYELT